MNTPKKQILPIEFAPVVAGRDTFTLAIVAGKIRRNGAAPLLVKSVPARMAADAAARSFAA